SDLNLSTVMGLPARTSTDIMKKTIREAAPNGNLTKDAFEEIASSWEKRAKENIGHANTYMHGLKNGYIPMQESMQEYQEPAQPQTATEQMQTMGGTPGTSGIPQAGIVIM